MDTYHGLSIVFDVFYVFDFVCDCCLYAYRDHTGEIICERSKIWNHSKKSITRLIFKALLFFPFYLINNSFYIVKIISVIHFRSMYIFGKKISALVTHSNKDSQTLFWECSSLTSEQSDGSVHCFHVGIHCLLPHVGYWLDHFQVSSRFGDICR